MMSTPPRGGGVGGGAPTMFLASPPLFTCQTSPSSQQVIPGTPEEGMKPAEAVVTEGGGPGAPAANDDDRVVRHVERVVMRYGAAVSLEKDRLLSYGERLL